MMTIHFYDFQQRYRDFDRDYLIQFMQLKETYRDVRIEDQKMQNDRAEDTP